MKLVLFSFSPTELPTVLCHRQEDDSLPFVATVVRFLSRVYVLPCFVEDYKKYDISPSAREVHEIRYPYITV